LQACGSCELKDACENCEFAKLLNSGEVTWSEDKIYKTDIEYIRKDALIEWAKNMKHICKGSGPVEKVFQIIIDKLNSM
jgi:hypothetical protein